MLALGEKRERRKAASPQAKLSLLPLELHLLKERLSFLPQHGNLSRELPTDSSTHGLYPLDTVFLVVIQYVHTLPNSLGWGLFPLVGNHYHLSPLGSFPGVALS